jgi:hypothetical protein
MSAHRKQEAVLRLLRGEDLELLSREPSAGFCRPRLRRRIDDVVIDGRDRGRAERLARGVPGRRRGLVEEPAR